MSRYIIISQSLFSFMTMSFIPFFRFSTNIIADFYVCDPKHLPKDKEKVNIPITKAINDEDIYDMNLAHAGYRTNLEDSYMGDVFLAFRCPSETPGLCAQLPYE